LRLIGARVELNNLLIMNPDSAVRLVLYEPKYKAAWDEFVRRSKNGVFLFYRDYLEYHADRFRDFSMLFFQGEQLVALMPANRDEEALVSHAGLTFGGIISDRRMTTTRMLRVFSALLEHLRTQGIQRLIYKAIPHMYHSVPAEEDLYALFVNNARLFRRDVSSTVFVDERLPLVRNRRKTLKHAQQLGLQVERSQDFLRFMTIGKTNLETRHGVKPVHTGEEVQSLAERFPENIKLFTVSRGEQMLGGVLIYESRNVAHGQYRFATEDGMKIGALDFVMDVLLNDVYREKRYVDFGISTVDNGRTLNIGLIRNKEAYGARATVYDSYELSLKP